MPQWFFFFFFPNKIVFFWKSLSCVWLFATPRTIALQAPLSMEFSRQILEWVAIPFSRESSQSRDKTQLPTLQVDSLPSEPPGKPKDTGMGSLSLLQWIFPTQESNWCLLPGRWTLYQLSYRGNPLIFFFNKIEFRTSLLPGEGNGYPLQYSCLENFMDRGGYNLRAHRVGHDWAD